jgi:hypothetical protein
MEGAFRRWLRMKRFVLMTACVFQTAQQRLAGTGEG